MTSSPIPSLTRQRQLLQQEYEYEKAAFRRQTETAGVARKVRQGLCWYPLRTGRSYYNALNQFVVEVERPADDETEHVFEPGKPVCFFTQDASGETDRHGGGGLLHYLNFTAQVCFVDGCRMVVALPGPEALAPLQADRLGVQLFLDETTYRLMFDALNRVIGAKTGRLAELRDLFYRAAPVGKRDLYPQRFPWLNASQEAAVNEVLRARDVAVVHGPPGTGKTTTLVEAVYETLHRESQVLVCAQSNMAVDWMAEKLADRGVAVLRIGNPSRVTDRMLSFTYERRFEAHPLYPQLWAVRKALRELYAHRPKGGNREAFRQKAAHLRERATEMEININEELFSQTRVVACTLAGSANRLLAGRSFDTLFIDEAAQALEAACWIALQKARRVILAGDHRQLPPTVKCPEALRGGLGHTLLQRIADNKPEAVTLLRVQYRMNDTLMQFSNRYFYHGLLQSAPEVKYRGLLDWDTAMEWIDTSDAEALRPYLSAETSSPTGTDASAAGEAWAETVAYGEEQAPDGLSRINRPEAELTLRVLRAYFEKIGTRRLLEERIDTGIISPYKGQVHLLRSLLRRDPFFKPFRPLLSVNTVDGFQGQERDVMLISLVRSNDEGQIGFLNDLRRMNVAITRARMKLILLGHAATLCRSTFYRTLFDYIRRQA